MNDMDRRMNDWMARAGEKGVMVLRGSYNFVFDQFALGAVLSEEDAWECFGTNIMDAVCGFRDVIAQSFDVNRSAIKGLSRDAHKISTYLQTNHGRPVFLCRTINGGLVMHRSVPFGDLLNEELEEIGAYNLENIYREYTVARNNEMRAKSTCLSLKECVRLQMNEAILDYAFIRGELPEEVVEALDPKTKQRYLVHATRNKLRDVVTKEMT